MDRPTILDTAKSHVTKDRQATHGQPENSFGTIAAFWTAYLKATGLLRPPVLAEMQPCIAPHDVAAMMMLLKAARIASVPGNEDSWVDAAGYAACGGELATLQKDRQLSIHLEGIPRPDIMPSPGEVRAMARELNENKSVKLSMQEALVVQNSLTNRDGHATSEHDARYINNLYRKYILKKT